MEDFFMCGDGGFFSAGMCFALLGTYAIGSLGTAPVSTDGVIEIRFKGGADLEETVICLKVCAFGQKKDGRNTCMMYTLCPVVLPANKTRATVDLLKLADEEAARGQHAQGTVPLTQGKASQGRVSGKILGKSMNYTVLFVAACRCRLHADGTYDSPRFPRETWKRYSACVKYNNDGVTIATLPPPFDADNAIWVAKDDTLAQMCPAALCMSKRREELSGCDALRCVFASWVSLMRISSPELDVWHRFFCACPVDILGLIASKVGNNTLSRIVSVASNNGLSTPNQGSYLALLQRAMPLHAPCIPVGFATIPTFGRPRPLTAEEKKSNRTWAKGFMKLAAVDTMRQKHFATLAALMSASANPDMSLAQAIELASAAELNLLRLRHVYSTKNLRTECYTFLDRSGVVSFFLWSFTEILMRFYPGNAVLSAPRNAELPECNFDGSVTNLQLFTNTLLCFVLRRVRELVQCVGKPPQTQEAMITSGTKEMLVSIVGWHTYLGEYLERATPSATRVCWAGIRQRLETVLELQLPACAKPEACGCDQRYYFIGDFYARNGSFYVPHLSEILTVMSGHGRSKVIECIEDSVPWREMKKELRRRSIALQPGAKLLRRMQLAGQLPPDERR